MKRHVLFLLFATCIVACTHRPTSSEMNKEEAQAIMQDVSERNRAYQPLTERDDTMMQRVVSYYKEHGTSNELMEAYYLLGSVYRDLHEAPKAMEAFLEGINAADTLAEDCRYDILVRLHGQKNDILRKQKLYQQAAKEEALIAQYAEKANDTLYMVASLWRRVFLFYKAKDYIKSIELCKYALNESQRLNKMVYAAQQLNTNVLANLEIGDVEEAKRLMAIYEQYSGEVDIKTYKCKFPIYYYTKGRLMLALGKQDSAELFFRREMENRDWNNRQAAYRGLHEVFRKKGSLDSAYKYSHMQCEAVDSDYQEKLSENLQNLHELYDYSRAQNDSFQKTLQLEEKQRRLQATWLVMGIVAIVVLFAFYYLYTRYQKRIAVAVLELERSNARLAEQEHALALLNEQLKHTENEAEKAMLAEQVKLAEEEAMRQEQVVRERQEELNRLRKWAKDRAKEIRVQYQRDEIFLHLLDLIKRNKAAMPVDYERIEARLIHDDARLMRRFYKTIPDASETDRRVFLLLRFGLRKSEASSLMAHERAASANTCDRMFERAVGRVPTNRAEAYNWLMEL